jgi:hypothetical protein
MEIKLIVLDLYLKELGIEPSIETINDRMLLQKAVYIGQLSGVDLGYRYSWYLKGPYSPKLTEDYYKLASLPDSEKAESASRSLNEEVRLKLASIRPLLQPPGGAGAYDAQWLEAVASWHYLRTVSKMTDKTAREQIEKSKPHLVNYIENANTALRGAQLIA